MCLQDQSFTGVLRTVDNGWHYKLRKVRLLSVSNTLSIKEYKMSTLSSTSCLGRTDCFVKTQVYSVLS